MIGQRAFRAPQRRTWRRVPGGLDPHDVIPTMTSIAFHNILRTATLSQHTTHDLVHARCKVPNVVRVQPRHRYPPVRRHVHMRTVHQRLRLLLVQPREAASSSAPSPHLTADAPEHPNLARNVPPLARGLVHLRQQPIQLLPHRDDPLRHRLDVPLPVFKQLRVAQDQRHLHSFSLRVHRSMCHSPAAPHATEDY